MTCEGARLDPHGKFKGGLIYLHCFVRLLDRL